MSPVVAIVVGSASVVLAGLSILILIDNRRHNARRRNLYREDFH